MIYIYFKLHFNDQFDVLAIEVLLYHHEHSVLDVIFTSIVFILWLFIKQCFVFSCLLFLLWQNMSKRSGNGSIILSEKKTLTYCIFYTKVTKKSNFEKKEVFSVQDGFTCALYTIIKRFLPSFIQIVFDFQV